MSAQFLIRAIHTTVKGRARYKVSGLYHSEALKRYLESELLKEQKIERVYANQLTGNILVIFNPDFSPNAIAFSKICLIWLTACILNLELEQKYRHQTREHQSMALAAGSDA